jgi:methionine synthase II (cobalamin-independent)
MTDKEFYDRLRKYYKDLVERLRQEIKALTFMGM